MNEQHEIFTAEQFRAQAAELSQAVSELQRRDSQTLDPQDPFENESEFHEYNCDYGEIVPQIRMPGCRIPMKPSGWERRRIRRYSHIIGAFLLGHYFLMNILAVILLYAFETLTYLADRSAAGTLPDNYDTLLTDYVTYSSGYTAINVLAIGTCTLLATFLGLKATRIPVSTLFRTKDLTVPRVGAYICIGLFLQMACGYLAYYISVLLEGVNVTVYEADFTHVVQTRATVISFIYSVIVAPVTEELLMRGLVMKNFARVSQRFGIMMSAFLFGIWHENLSQFVLAFLVGCFFGYIDIKHNSLLPSILVHMAVNLNVELSDIFSDYGLETAEGLLDLIVLGMLVIGLILFIRMLFRERLPHTTPAQAERGIRIALASPPLLLVIVAHLGTAIILIVQESM